MGQVLARTALSKEIPLGRTYPELRQIVRVSCAVAGRCCACCPAGQCWVQVWSVAEERSCVSLVPTSPYCVDLLNWAAYGPLNRSSLGGVMRRLSPSVLRPAVSMTRYRLAVAASQGALTLLVMAGCSSAASTSTPAKAAPAKASPSSAIGQRYASTQNKPPEQQFRMRIEEVRSIPGRGTLVTGPIEQGAVTAGDGVEIVGSGAKPIASVVTAVLVSGKVSERGHAGDTVGVLLRAVNANQVTRGQVLRAS